MIGSVAFVGLLSFVLVSVAKGFNPHAPEAAAELPAIADGKTPPGLKPALRKKPVAAADPTKDD